MNFIQRTFLPVILIIISATVIFAQQKPTSQQGNVLYTPPAGWQKVDKNGALVFVPPDATEKSAVLLSILPGQDLDVDFRAWFDATLAKAHEGGKVIAGGEVTATDSDGYPVLYTQLVIDEKNGTRSFRFYVAAHPGKRAELIAYFATDADAYKKHLSEFDQFIKSVDFANFIAEKNNKNSNPAAKSASSPGAANSTNSANGLYGLYVGTVSRQQFNPVTHYYDYIVRQLYYLFTADGRVYAGLPKGGTVKNFDFARAERDEPAAVGIYKIVGAQIQIEWRDGRRDNLPFERSAGRIKLGINNLFAVDSFDNYRLEGVYANRTFTNTSAGGNTGGVSGERAIQFSRDGRFAAQNFVGFVGSGSGAGAATSSQTSGSGTYQIDGNTLNLSYADGRRVRATFFVYPENVKEARPGLIVIDGVSYLLR